MGMEELQNPEPVIRRVLIAAGILIVLCLAAVVLLSGCGGHYYEDNPRNMKNMTADQIERALAERE